MGRARAFKDTVKLSFDLVVMEAAQGVAFAVNFGAIGSRTRLIKAGVQEPL